MSLKEKREREGCWNSARLERSSGGGRDKLTIVRTVTSLSSSRIVFCIRSSVSMSTLEMGGMKKERARKVKDQRVIEQT